MPKITKEKNKHSAAKKYIFPYFLSVAFTINQIPSASLDGGG